MVMQRMVTPLVIQPLGTERSSNDPPTAGARMFTTHHDTTVMPHDVTRQASHHGAAFPSESTTTGWFCKHFRFKYRLLHAKSAIMSECVARVIYRHSFAWNKVFKARLSRHLIVPHVCIATLPVTISPITCALM